jgi:ABC-type antimicrobial peptide transport system permease subunit
VAAIDPTLPVYHVRAMTEVMGDSLERRRLSLEMLAIFAGLALLLASIGIYGVTSYGVAQRHGEIGLRMALGADRGQVLGMMIRGGMTTIVAGLGLGLVLSLVFMRLIKGLLYGTQTTDPLALGGAALLLTAAALMAIFIPARRATRVNPVEALRYE